jgi:hypothetical protein
MTKKFAIILILVLIALWLTSSEVLSMQAHNDSSSTDPIFTPTPLPIRMPKDLRLSLSTNQQTEENNILASSPVRGVPDDKWADVIIGQPDFSQVTPDEVVGNKIFNAGGVYVDRSTIPNRVYVYDAGNNRILGFSSIGVCTAGSEAGHSCTSNSDCPASACTIDSDKAADIIFGQPSPNRSACNGDSGFQNYPDLPAPSATTLCGVSPLQISIAEGGTVATMATDPAGNLYVPDFYNNRVLRFNLPFMQDTVADYVWGQSDFSQGNCNQGRSNGLPDNKSLCLGPRYGGNNKAGVAIDPALNLWVTDTNNNRVLRFPYNSALGAPAQTADLVLGQPDFTSANPGLGPNQMHYPGSIRVDAGGTVYVVDGQGGILDGRLLVFHPPLSNGMAASQVFEGVGAPTGMELDSSGGLWINNSEMHRILHYVNGNLQTVKDDVPWGQESGIGIDRDDNLMISGWRIGGVNIYRLPAYIWTSVFLKMDPNTYFNQLGPRGIQDASGLEVTDSQLVVADMQRILFWNNPTQLASNYPPADGVIGQPDFTTRPLGGPRFGRLRADTHGRLWVVRDDLSKAQILAYQLPLATGAQPIIEISSPITLLGGGTFDWTWSLTHSGLVYQPQCDCLWLSDRDNNRVFRIRNVSSDQRVVDIVLGQKQNPSDLSVGIHCNQGRDSDDLYVQPTSPSQDSLCHPGGLAMDSRGNLFVSDDNLEVAGNWRLLEYDGLNLPIFPSTALFDIPASRVYGRNGSFSEPNCVVDDPMCAPWEPVFYPDNQMIVGFNGYYGSHFPQIYQDPIINPLPYDYLKDFYSHAISMRLDSLNNLYVLDGSRDRVLIYHATAFTISGNAGGAGATLSYAINGSPKTVTADGGGNYQIPVPNHWSGTVTPSKTGYSFTPTNRSYTDVAADKTGQDYTASLNTYQLSVSKNVPGGGTVSSNPAGINCGAICSYTFDANTSITLIVVPISPYTFGGWSGGGCSGTGTCTVNMISNLSVTAMFNPPGNQTLTVIKSGPGNGTVTSSPPGIDCGSTCLASFNEITSVTLTATPISPSTFGGWNGAGCSGTGTCTVSMSSAQFVSAAFFSPGELALTVNKGGTGSGRVTSSPAGINCGLTCLYGFASTTMVTLTAEAGAGSTFTGWIGSGCSGTGACTVAMSSARSVSAYFKPITPEENRILLVDDDDNYPDVRSYYIEPLTILGTPYDVWDTNNSDNEPGAAVLSNYKAVIWFTGAEYGGHAGPGPAGESALGTWLNGGGCFLISSQDYYWDRGLTSFASNYLGVSSVIQDVDQTTATGTGSVFDGLGLYSLSYPFDNNSSDFIYPNGTAESAFNGEEGSIAVNKNGGAYRTAYLGFPFEAISSLTGRQQVIGAFLNWCAKIPVRIYLPMVRR